MTKRHHSLCRYSFLLSIAVLLCAGSIHAQLPPAAQEAFDKGVLAAQQQEWMIAIQNLEKARLSAPDAPIIYFNLGLAESKVAGRELRATAWFGAYLASNPNAPNASAVKDLIARLQIKNDGNTFRLIQSFQDAVYGTERQRVFNSQTDTVIDLWASTGNFAGALQYADSFQDPYYKNWVQRMVARRQADAGDMAGAHQTFLIALRTLDLIKDPKEKQIALHQFATAQAEAGDVAGAIQTVDRFDNDRGAKYSSQSAIALAQAKLGDTLGARQTLDAARVTADRAGDPFKDYYKKLVPEVEAMLNAGNGVKSNGQSTALAPPTISGISVSDWLKMLEGDLNSRPYLDLAGYLKSLPKGDDAQKMFEGLRDTTENFVQARNVVNEMLKRLVNK